MEHVHYGLVVDDIERAIAEYAAALSLTWADVATRAVRAAWADGGIQGGGHDVRRGGGGTRSPGFSAHASPQ
ncbi:hypothetical protein [Streptosporangium sp. NPDC049644]|uniref:hypothetical protein n=1 Tax=Streptosporangium sp. NPDC049644 TaxID=3155507 RepID=UPI00343D8A65